MVCDSFSYKLHSEEAISHFHNLLREFSSPTPNCLASIFQHRYLKWRNIMEIWFKVAIIQMHHFTFNGLLLVLLLYNIQTFWFLDAKPSQYYQVSGQGLISRSPLLNEPLVSIGQVGCSSVPAWRPFQWLLYMSRVSQKKFGDPRSMHRTQR